MLKNAMSVKFLIIMIGMCEIQIILLGLSCYQVLNHEITHRENFKNIGN